MNQWGIKVTRHDTAYRYLAQSRTREGVHMVDISANNKLGDCACENFRFKRIIEFRASGLTVSDKYRCDHIRACREEFTNDLIDRLVGNEQLRPESRPDKLPPPEPAQGGQEAEETEYPF